MNDEKQESIMCLKNISIILLSLLFSLQAKAASIPEIRTFDPDQSFYAYELTNNSYYMHSYIDDDLVTIEERRTLSGFLLVNVDSSQVQTNNQYLVTIDYSQVLLNGNSFRSPDLLVTDSAGFNSAKLISGWWGENSNDPYTSYGNSTLAPFPFLCVECGYEMQLDLTSSANFGNPLVLSYHESNPYGTGESHFEIYVSEVPLPATVWLFSSGLIGLLAIRKKNYM